MSIITTMTAHCDHKEPTTSRGDVACLAKVDLNPRTTQRFLDLLDKGWAVSHLGSEEPKTYCPDHTEDADDQEVW